MLGDKYDIVFGDDCVGFYKNGKLVVRAVKLTFGDIIDHCDITCNLWSGDMDIYNDPSKLPENFKEVVLDDDAEEEASA